MRLLAAAVLSGSLAATASAEVVDFKPGGKVHWRARNIFAPITALFLGFDHPYGDRMLEVETTPPGAVLDLFYVRANFQKRYEQADAPVTLVLPSRVDTGPRDSLTIRALLEGYRMAEVSLKMPPKSDKLMIDLELLPNTLQVVAHRYFAGRASLSFLTQEALAARVQKAADGFSLVLTETATSPAATRLLEEIRSPLIEAVEGQQLGEDLLVRVTLTGSARDDNVDLRSRQYRDPIRELHVFSLDLVPPDRGAAAVERARAALGRIRTEHVTGCAAQFDDSLRKNLDPAALARALTPRGSFTDPYLRAAMKRLGEVSPNGVISLTDGTTFHPGAPIELSAAMSQVSEARGYLALLRRFVSDLEPELHRRETLRGLVAPEQSPGEFDARMEQAEARERECLRGVAQAKPY